LFSTRTREEWSVFLAGVDGCCEPAYSLQEAVNSSAVQALGMIRENSVLPPVRVVPSGADVGISTEQVGRAPQLGEHTDAVLRDLCGLAPEEVRALREKHVV
jgi:crotonobetainyl-CoA:carnitine CoA-transferase CaiB-like acyl-CoA transferase